MQNKETTGDLAIKDVKKNNSNERKYRSNNRPNNKKGKKTESVKISFLGGLNEVGKNITLIEYENDMFLIDCGLAFPDQDMPGVDLVLPDFTYIERNADKIRGHINYPRPRRPYWWSCLFIEDYENTSIWYSPYNWAY